MHIGIEEAKNSLSELIPAVLGGAEVIITDAGHPLVKLVPVAKKSGQRKLGIYKGVVEIHGDILEPLPEEVQNSLPLGK